MTLPKFVLRVLDPAQLFFERNGSLPRGAVVFGPEVPDGSRPATAAELSDLQQRARAAGDAHEAGLADVERRWGGDLRLAAEELLGRGSVELELGERRIHVLVRAATKG